MNNFMRLYTVIRETVRPYLVWDQLRNDPKFFTNFLADLKEWSKYHSDPAAFFIGHLMDYIMRFRVDTEFYRMLNDFEEQNNLKEPYFA